MNVQNTPPKSPGAKAEPSKRPRADNEFLPAALEILETPASPIRTAFIWFICILATGTLVWTWLGTFDIVSTAQGKIQPVGRVKVVQSLGMGKTKSVPVHNGMAVKAGDILVELDDTEIRAEENGYIAGLQAYRAEIVRRNAILSTVADWQKQKIWSAEGQVANQSPVFPDDIPGAIRQREKLVYKADISQLRSSLGNLDAQRKQRQSEIDGLIETIAAQQILVSTLTERVSMRSELIASEAGSRAQVIDAMESQQSAAATLATQTRPTHPGPRCL